MITSNSLIYSNLLHVKSHLITTLIIIVWVWNVFKFINCSIKLFFFCSYVFAYSKNVKIIRISLHLMNKRTDPEYLVFSTVLGIRITKYNDN